MSRLTFFDPLPLSSKLTGGAPRDTLQAHLGSFAKNPQSQIRCQGEFLRRVSIEMGVKYYIVITQVRV